MTRGCPTMVVLSFVLTAHLLSADTIILKDGSFVEGEITLETSRIIHVNTRFGIRNYSRSEIDRIVASVDALDPQAVNRFAQLPPPVRAVLNAEAEYNLGKYDQALVRLQHLQAENLSPAIQTRADWLVIEINERLGRWTSAMDLLEKKQKTGTPQEKTRAKAHLSILKANPDHDLRYVGEKHARNFLRDAFTLSLARRPGSLKDHEIMRLALEEYCEQLLVEHQWSVTGFADRLDPNATYEACQRLPRVGDVARHLPYIQDLKRAEATLAKARAILGDYGSAFEMDLVRTELRHLLPVMEQLFKDAVELSPENFSPPFHRTSGRLTKKGRQQWRDRCDAFLVAARPFARLIEYMIDRVEHFPRGLRDLRELLLDYRRRTDAMIKAVQKARGRTHV